MHSAADYAWLIPVLPLVGALITGMGLISFNRTINRLRKPVAVLLLSCVGAAAVISYAILFEQLGGAPPVEHLFVWASAGSFSLPMGYVVDPLGSVMLALVTTIALLVLVYSHGYMAHDKGYVRFFTYLALFSSSMLGLTGSAESSRAWKALLKGVSLGAAANGLSLKTQRIGSGRSSAITSPMQAADACFFQGCGAFQAVTSSLESLWSNPGLSQGKPPLRLAISDLEVNDGDIANLVAAIKPHVEQGAVIGVLAVQLPFEGKVFNSQGIVIHQGQQIAVSEFEGMTLGTIATTELKTAGRPQ